MICLPCREGAKRFTAGAVDAARELHAQCLGGTHCFCQHDLEVVTRPDRKPDPRRGA